MHLTKRRCTHVCWFYVYNISLYICIMAYFDDQYSVTMAVFGCFFFNLIKSLVRSGDNLPTTFHDQWNAKCPCKCHESECFIRAERSSPIQSMAGTNTSIINIVVPTLTSISVGLPNQIIKPGIVSPVYVFSSHIAICLERYSMIYWCHCVYTCI